MSNEITGVDWARGDNETRVGDTRVSDMYTWLQNLLKDDRLCAILIGWWSNSCAQPTLWFSEAPNIRFMTESSGCISNEVSWLGFPTLSEPRDKMWDFSKKSYLPRKPWLFSFLFFFFVCIFFLTSLGLHCGSSLVAYRCSIKPVYLPQIRRLLETLVSHKDELTGWTVL